MLTGFKKVILILILFFSVFLTPLLAQGPGSAISLGAANHMVSTAAPIVTGNNFTISAWIYPVSLNDGQLHIIASNYNGGSNPAGFVFGFNAAGQLYFYDGQNFHTTQAIALNQWSHVAVSADPANVSIYLNGTQIYTAAAAASVTGNANFTIGNTPSGSLAFAGYIDELWIKTGGVISLDDIRRCMHANNPSIPLTAHYRFDSNSGTSAVDEKGNYPGTLQNGASWITSTAPLGNAVTGSFVSAANGAFSIPGTDISMTFTASAGQKFYVTKISATPDGSTGSSASLAGKYWIIKTFDAGAFTADAAFLLENGAIGPLDKTAPGNIKVFSRELYKSGDSWGTGTAASSALQNSITAALTEGIILGQFTIGTNSTSPLTGPPSITSDPASYNYDSVYAGSSKSKTFALTNNGTGWLYVAGVTPPAGFTSSFTQPFALAPGTGSSLNITFNPTDGVNYSGNVTISSNVADYTIPVEGVGILPAPTPLLPVNGNTAVSIEPVLSWSAVNKAASYELWVDDNADFAAPRLYVENEGINTSRAFDATINPFPLINNKLYYWKVASIAPNGRKAFSQVMHFKTYPDITPQLSYPDNGALLYGNSVHLSWNTGTAGLGLKFKVQVLQQPDQPSELQWKNSPALTPTANLYYEYNFLFGKKYWWRVIVLRASDNEVLDYSEARYFTTAGGTAVTVYPSWPVNNPSVYTNTPTLNWYCDQPFTGLKFQVKYSMKNTVLNGVLTQDTLSLPMTEALYTQFTSELAANKRYYWQVRAYYPAINDFSNWSAIESFTTAGPGVPLKPLLSYPANGETVYTTDPFICWYTEGSSTGLTFRYQIRKDNNNFSSGGNIAGTTSNLYVQRIGLVPGTTYFWRVRSESGSGNSAWSAVGSFTLAGGTDYSYPVALWPAGDPIPVLYTTKPTLSWYLEGSPLGLTKYVVKWKEGDASSNWLNEPLGAEINDINTPFFTLTSDLTAGKTYSWSVAAAGVTPNAYTDWSAGSFTIAGATGSSVPVLLAPENNSIYYASSATLSWFVNGPSEGIQGYELTYSTSDDFAPGVTTVIAPQNLAIPYYELPPLISGATYYWKVRSWLGGTEYSGYSTVFNFTVNPGSSEVQPFAGSPVNNVIINTVSPTLSWYLRVPSSAQLNYELEYADNPSFRNSSIVKDLNTTQHMISNLEKNRKYYWRVRSKKQGGAYSAYSPAGTFRIPDNATGVKIAEKVIPKEYSLEQNYPNPFNPSTRIRYHLPKAGFISITVYDMLGNRIIQLVNEQKEAGIYETEFDGSRLSSGVYYYRMQSEGFIRTGKMILMK